VTCWVLGFSKPAFHGWRKALSRDRMVANVVAIGCRSRLSAVGRRRTDDDQAVLAVIKDRRTVKEVAARSR
jgi:hypothetical protein